MKLTLERRLVPSKSASWGGVGLSIFLALIMGGVVFLSAGANPFKAYGVMFLGAFGDLYNISEVMVKAIPLILCGLSIAIPAKILIWNIGGEGQLAVGGIGSAAVALFLSPFLPSPLVLPSMILAGFLAGGLWASAAGFLKAKMGVNEILTTLMLNYVAIYWMENLYFGPWRDPTGTGFPGTAIFPEAAWLPRFPQTRVHLGLIFGVLAALILQWAFFRTRWGYEMRVIGENPKAARYAGMNITRHILWVMFLSGGLAGLAGMAEVSGIHYRLQQGLTVGYGYVGIIVAWLSRLNPMAIIVVALFLASLLVGGDQLQSVMHLPSAVGLVLEGTLLFFVLGSDFLARYRIKLSTGSREQPSKEQQGGA
jgi:general nucleoside transport system permease protein